MRRAVRGRLAVALTVSLSLCAPALAQDAAPDTEARYERAEQYRLGTGVPTDLDRARELHESLVAEGYMPSLVRLGAIYEEQGRHREAIDAFERAAEAGSGYARLRLAAGNAQGSFGPLSDPLLGFTQLRDIASRGDSELAELYLADAYAKGQGTERDIDRAVEIYRDLSGRGYALADARLGRLHADGEGVPQDDARAIEYFGKAVAGGYAYGRIGLAKALVEAGRGAEALPVIDAAVAQDVALSEALRAAWHYDGSFGAASQPDFGARELKRLAEAGDVYAARQALIAHERRSRRIDDLDLEKVLSRLDDAAAGGDRLAMITLARAYRELSWLIPDARGKHRALVETYGDQFGPDYEVPERLETIYDPNRHARSRVEAYEFLAGRQGEAFASGLLRLRSIEPRAFVFALENELPGLGYRTGPTDGLLDKRTLDAVLDFCRDSDIWEVCRHGPLTYDAARAIVSALSSRRDRS